MCNQRWMNRSECQIPCKTAGEYTGMRLENAPHKMLLSGSCGGRMAPRDAGAGAGWRAAAAAAAARSLLDRRLDDGATLPVGMIPDLNRANRSSCLFVAFLASMGRGEHSQQRHSSGSDPGMIS